MGVSPAYRGAEGPTKVQEAASRLYIPRRGRAGGVPGGERGVPAPPPRELGGPAPPPSPAACGSVRRSPGLRASGPSRAAPRGPPNFQRCPAPRPRRRLGVSIVGPAPAQSAGVRGPMALDRPRSRPPPPPQPPALRRPPLFSRCHSALSPALRSAPCPAALASGPGPENPAAGRPGIRRLPPRLPPWVSVPLSLCRSPRSPCRCLRLSLRGLCLLPAALPVSPLPPSASALSLSPARLYLSSSRSPSVLLCLSLSPSHSRCGPRCLGPRPAPPPRPRLAREPELPPPAARRELPTRGTPPRFARLSPLLTRDPRPSAEAARPPPRAPGPRAARRARAGPAPSPRPSGSSKPLRSAGLVGQGRGLGAAGPRSCPGSCPGFPPPSRSAPPRTHSEDPLRVF